MDSASTKLCLFSLAILSCAAAVGLLTAAEKDRQQRKAVAIAMTGGNPPWRHRFSVSSDALAAIQFRAFPVPTARSAVR